MIITGFVCSLILGFIFLCNFIMAEDGKVAFVALLLIAMQTFVCIGLGMAL